MTSNSQPMPLTIAVRLQASLKSEAERVAKAEGTMLNQFINAAVAEKLSALRTADYLAERALRADLGNEPPRETRCLPRSQAGRQKGCFEVDVDELPALDELD